MEVLFGNRETRDLSEVDITALAAEIPVVNAKILLSEALQIVSIVSGKGAARRLTEGGGVKVNGEKVDGDIIVNTRDLIKVGKNKFIFVR
jgi:tyrosyl-tRNA synthetase